MKNSKENYVWVTLRLTLGFIMLWAFFDKLLGLGFATAADKTWLKGVSPTMGFLKFGTHGPFAQTFNSLAGSGLVDWLFMLGLLLIGVALMLGIGLKIAGYSGALLMFFMWLALIPPKNNPIIDEHIIYLIIFLGFTVVPAGNYFGLGKWWSRTKFVKKYPILQ